MVRHTDRDPDCWEVADAILGHLVAHNDHPMSLKEIADMTGLNKTTILKVERRAIRKLREDPEAEALITLLKQCR